MQMMTRARVSTVLADDDGLFLIRSNEPWTLAALSMSRACFTTTRSRSLRTERSQRSSTPTGDGAGNTLFGPNLVAVDTSGNAYVTGLFSDNVFKVTPQRSEQENQIDGRKDGL